VSGARSVPRVLRLVALLCAALALSACASQANGAVQAYGPGFLRGLIHGVIAPISFFGSLVLDEIAIYAVPNNGGWYDFGFLLGLSAWAGGGAAASS